MSGFSSIPLFTRRRALWTRRGAPLLLVAGALGATLLAGCGGGGGNGNSNNGNSGSLGTNSGSNSGTNSGSNTGGVQFNASVIGKITDTQGNGIPGVSIIPDSGGTATTSLSQGGYRLDNLSGNVVHRITASVTQKGVPYTGSTQVLTQGGFLVSNANILVSAASAQTTISGTVTDTNGSPIGGARVTLALPNNANYSSLVAYTDPTTGAYTLSNVPVNPPAGTPITIAASVAGSQNQTATLPNLQAGGGYNQNFRLAASTNQSLTTPTVVGVTVATEPTDSQSGLVRARAARSTSVYEGLRRRLSPAYARTATRTPAQGRRKIAQALGQYAIETDLAFTPVQSGSVLGYTVYRTSGATVPTESTSDAYDFLQDPLANYYADLTFSFNQSTTSSNVQYNFALSATNTDNTESALSPVFSVIPLGPLTLNIPTPEQTFDGTKPITVTWSPVSGATKYYVFVYDQYPTINTSPVASFTLTGTATTAPATSQALPTLTRGLDYYVVVVGGADQNENLISGQTTSSTPVPNAETTFSQITRFHVQ